MDLKTALSAIPSAAKNPFAFLAYLAALGAWVFIVGRVRRNKNLLANLDKLPAKDRLEALRIEMGDIPIPKGLSANDWLKARIQRYYFWGFAMLCALAVTILAIAAYEGQTKVGALERSATAVKEASEAVSKAADPFASETRALDDLKLGVLHKYVESRLGVPQNEQEYKTVTCATYQMHSYHAYFVYDNSSQTLQFFSVTSTDDSFRPELKRWPFEGRCLGCLSFADVVETTPVYFDYSSKFWVYVESYDSRTSSGRYTVFIASRDGADYGTVPDPSKLPTVLRSLMENKGDASALTPGAQRVFNDYRKLTKFNTFAWLADFTIPDESERIAFDLERGGHSTCPDQVVFE